MEEDVPLGRSDSILQSPFIKHVAGELAKARVHTVLDLEDKVSKSNKKAGGTLPVA